MRYLQIYESFGKEYLDKQEELRSEFTKKEADAKSEYEKEILRYLYELHDEFRLESEVWGKYEGYIDAAVFHFNFSVDVDDERLYRLDEYFHQGIFDRIIQDYPGTKVTFEVNFQEQSGPYLLGHGTSRQYKTVDELIKSVHEYLHLNSGVDIVKISFNIF